MASSSTLAVLTLKPATDLTVFYLIGNLENGHFTFRIYVYIDWLKPLPPAFKSGKKGCS